MTIMNKITLRDYTHKIKNLKASGNYQEAIQHCLHIIKIFPKHAETYRYLGESYLEIKRFQEALNILKRVLSVFPDDFIAHIGVSVIQESLNNLDEAVWHMERAFEIQPARFTVRGELTRLYKLRDGKKPPDIRLTHAALARLYLRGGLYPQAIAELLDTIENSDRIDINLMLAQAFFLNNQLPSSIEPARKVLKLSPFCLEANRIMLMGSGITGEDEITIACKRRLSELDPYYQFVSTGQQTTEMIPNEAVLLEWLPDYPIPPHNTNKPRGDDLTWILDPDDTDILSRSG
jgi:tetratricopeptide (TPR) repeat protein